MTTTKRKRKSRERDTVIPLHHVDVNHGKKKKEQKALSVFLFVTIIMLLGIASSLFDIVVACFRDSKKKSDAAKNRVVKIRSSWKDESKRFSDRMFFRLFRMPRPCFNRLCARIERVVGKKEFKSEQYIQKLKEQKFETQESRMFHATTHTTGEYIPGEIKVCLALRYLAGGSYLDLYLWYNSDPDYIINIVRQVIENWFCNDEVMRIDIYRDVLQNSQNVKRISEEFAIGSDGILKGCIGAIDGWLVKIKCPSLFEVSNPGKYMSRKGFFALNVQAIVDKKKRILWRHIGQKGSAHDSTVFKNTKLYKHLLLISDELYRKGLYIVGDSAYSIRNFILCPYDNTKPNTKEDTFNFFLLSQRIYVECTFGEIDRRWGIFWKPLEGSLQNHRNTIDAAMRLHNLIVDYREEMKSNGMMDQVDEDFENEELMYDSDEFLIENSGTTLGVFGDNIGVRGRQEADQTLQKNRGIEMRDRFCEQFKQAGKSRPKNGEMTGTKDRHNRINV